MKELFRDIIESHGYRIDPGKPVTKLETRQKRAVIVTCALVIVGVVAFAASSMLFGSCATAKPLQAHPQAPKATPAVEAAQRAAPSASAERRDIVIAQPDYDIPKDSPQAPKPSSALVANDIQSQTATYTIVPTKQNYQGGTVYYAFLPNNLYKVFCAPDQVTDIQLQAGEMTVGKPILGNTKMFSILSGTSYADGVKVEHYYIQPLIAGQQTSLIINTDRHIYTLTLFSNQSTFMPRVTWAYPQEQLSTGGGPSDGNSRIYLGDISMLDFGYDIIPASVHMPTWAPTQVFNDGKRTFLFFPSSARASKAPSLLDSSTDPPAILNYRAVGQYFIVDTVLEKADLVIDTNRGNVIHIVRKH